MYCMALLFRQECTGGFETCLAMVGEVYAWLVECRLAFTVSGKILMLCGTLPM